MYALSCSTYSVSGDNPSTVPIIVLLPKLLIIVSPYWIEYCVITSLVVSGGIHFKVTELIVTETTSNEQGSLGTVNKNYSIQKSYEYIIKVISTITYGTHHKKVNILYLTLSAVRTVVRLYLAPKVIVVQLCYDRSTIVLHSLVRSILRSLHTYVSVSAITILHKHNKHIVITIALCTYINTIAYVRNISLNYTLLLCR